MGFVTFREHKDAANARVDERSRLAQPPYSQVCGNGLNPVAMDNPPPPAGYMQLGEPPAPAMQGYISFDRTRSQQPPPAIGQAPPISTGYIPLKEAGLMRPAPTTTFVVPVGEPQLNTRSQGYVPAEVMRRPKPGKAGLAQDLRMSDSFSQVPEDESLRLSLSPVSTAPVVSQGYVQVRHSISVMTPTVAELSPEALNVVKIAPYSKVTLEQVQGSKSTMV
jgi:hypothetical protein